MSAKAVRIPFSGDERIGGNVSNTADSWPSTKKAVGQARPSSKEREALQCAGTARPCPVRPGGAAGQGTPVLRMVVNTHSNPAVCPLPLILAAPPRLLGASEKASHTLPESQSRTGFSQCLGGPAASVSRLSHPQPPTWFQSTFTAVSSVA